MRCYENRRVLVTGSGRGIGKGIARRFAEGGAKILLVARSRDELEQTSAELRGLTSDVRAVALDLTVPDSAREIVTAAAEAWDGLDILVTNAGAAPQGGFLELEDTAWVTGFGLKMFANLRVIRQAWPLLMKSAGHLLWRGIPPTSLQLKALRSGHSTLPLGEALFTTANFDTGRASS